MSKTPWIDYSQNDGYMPDPQNPRYKIWDTAQFPFVVRWSVPTQDRLTRWISHNRNFRTMAEAITAYRRPFAGLSVDCVMFNGKEPGKHLDTLAYRKAGKSTAWHDQVPAELRA